MFGPSSPWPPCSCAPSSVPQWLLYRTVLITVLFGVASSADWRKDLQSDFTGHVQTIGPLDGRLWAITTEWTVHEMTPCDKGNETLSLCMEIGFPVRVDTKWPELAKSVKGNGADFNFTVQNSVFMNSTENHQLLVMHNVSFQPKEFFGFNFSSNTSIDYVFGEVGIFNYLWISSDEENKTSALDSGKKLNQILFYPIAGRWEIISLSIKNICKVSHESDLSLRITEDKCDHGEMDWTVLKAVRYGGQFYFFAKDKVYIFSAVENVDTKVYTLSYDKFIHCKEPTTTKPPSTHPMVTTSKGFNKTVIIVVAIVGLALLVIILIILAFVCCKKPSKVNSKSSAKPYSSKAGNKESLEKAGSSKKIETQSRPSKMAKSQAEPKKKAQSDANPRDKVTSQAGPSKVAESQVGQSKVAESKAGPSKVAESKAGPSKVAESKAGPSKVAESKAGPSKVAESKAGPKKKADPKATPKKKADPKATPKKKADPKATPKKKAEAKATPKKKAEAKATPKKKADPKATPKKKAEPKAKPSKKDESKAGLRKDSSSDTFAFEM